jgi:hypothetical protein
MRRYLKPEYIAIFVLALWTLWLFLTLSTSYPVWLPDFLVLDTTDTEKLFARRGQIGDAFGAFNSLVSAFAFIGLIFTLRTQEDQLRLQERNARSTDLLIRQQQFQEQLFRAIDAYRSLLSDVIVFSGEAEYKGRMALNFLWTKALLHRIEAEPGSTFQKVLRRQIESPDRVSAGFWDDRKATADSVNLFIKDLDQDFEKIQPLLQRINEAWGAVYLENRFQLDALFRAWYTVYRTLETADKYEIDISARFLYSASFRAQLSWIELAFLLMNQSNLNDDYRFEKACRISNKYATFDNLDFQSDVIVAILRHAVFAKLLPLEDGTLSPASFKSSASVNSP